MDPSRPQTHPMIQNKQLCFLKSSRAIRMQILGSPDPAAFVVYVTQEVRILRWMQPLNLHTLSSPPQLVLFNPRNNKNDTVTTWTCVNLSLFAFSPLRSLGRAMSNHRNSFRGESQAALNDLSCLRGSDKSLCSINQSAFPERNHS